MKTFRLIPFVFALVAACATGGVWAEDDESVRPVRVAQAQAQSGDGRQATLGDIRHFESRMNERMDRMDARIERMESRMIQQETRLDARIGRLEDRMVQMFLALLAVMIALHGLPHLPDWWNRLRANGKSATVVGVLVAALAIAGAGAAIVAVA